MNALKWGDIGSIVYDAVSTIDIKTWTLWKLCLRIVAEKLLVMLLLLLLDKLCGS